MSSRICEPSNERVKSNLYIYHSNAERQAATHLSQGRVARAYDVPFFPQKTRLFLKCTVTLQLRGNLVTLFITICYRKLLSLFNFGNIA